MFLVQPNPAPSVDSLSLDQPVLQKEQHAVDQVILQVKIVIVLQVQLVQLILQLQASLHLNLASTIVISKPGKLLQKTEQD